MGTYADYVAITNSATANSASAASAMTVTTGATIYGITLTSLNVGTTYAVKIDAPGISGPQTYVLPCNGAAANTNGGKLCPATKTIKCHIKIPGSQIKIQTYAGVASATCRVGIQWSDSGRVPPGYPTAHTYSDFATATPGTAGTEAAASAAISVTPGKRIVAIAVANPDFLGSIYTIRLEGTGLPSPQTFCLPSIYEATGTEIEYSNAWTQDLILVDIPIPSTTNSILPYATADVNSTKCVIGLIWQ